MQFQPSLLARIISVSPLAYNIQFLYLCYSRSTTWYHTRIYVPLTPDPNCHYIQHFYVVPPGKYFFGSSTSIWHYLIWYHLQYVGAIFVSEKKWELLNKISAAGQLSIMGRFTRSPFVASATMVSIELTFCNHHSSELNNIRMEQKVCNWIFVPRI